MRVFLATILLVSTLDRYPLHRVAPACCNGRLRAPSKPQALNNGPLRCANGSLHPACALLTPPFGRDAEASHDDLLPPQLETFPINKPEGPRDGNPRFCRQLDHARSYADGRSWDWLKERMLELVLAVIPKRS